jgi:polyvinyl alcohol dehydrogenase (cytochrome)
VWDTPAVDVAAGRIYLGTGNNYTAPDDAAACAQANPGSSSCASPDDHFDSALALNLSDGSIAWYHRVEGWDAWTVSCAFLPPGVTWCASPTSPDYDFGGSGPNLITVNGPNGSKQKLVGIGQKSGVYWAFDAATGATAWHTLVGPGAALGGIEWGTAYDGKRIYVPLSNSYHLPYTLAGGAAAASGSWAALDPATGKFDWQVPTPDGAALAIGPASEANGVVYVGDTAAGGDKNMFALDASSGKVLWSYAASGSVWSGPAIANGTLYWGSGYSLVGPPGVSGNNTFYAFSLNGK